MLEPRRWTLHAIILVVLRKFSRVEEFGFCDAYHRAERLVSIEPGRSNSCPWSVDRFDPDSFFPMHTACNVLTMADMSELDHDI